MRGFRNFKRDGSRSTAYGVQVQFANHFVRLEGGLTGQHLDSQKWVLQRYINLPDNQEGIFLKVIEFTNAG